MRVSGFSILPFCGELPLSSGLAAFDCSLLLACVPPTSTQDDLSPLHRVGGGYYFAHSFYFLVFYMWGFGLDTGECI